MNRADPALARRLTGTAKTIPLWSESCDPLIMTVDLVENRDGGRLSRARSCIAMPTLTSNAPNRRRRRRPRPRRVARLSSLFAMVTVMVCLVGTVSAQGYRSVGIYRASISAADIDAMERILNTNFEQRALLEALLSGYEAAFDAGVGETRAQLAAITERARKAESPEAWKSFAPERASLERRWEAEIVKLEASFFADCQSILNADQADAWTKFERERRRRTTLAVGTRVASEGIDLVALVDDIDMHTSDRARLDSTLEQYASELHVSLGSRNKALDDIDREMRQMSEQQRWDNDRSQELMQKAQQKRMDLRAINLRYSELLVNMMSRATADEFRQRFNEESFPRIYRETQVDRYQSLLDDLDTLTPEQESQVESVIAEHERKVTPINEQLAKLQVDRENSTGMPFASRSGGSTGSAASNAARQSRREEQELWSQRRTMETETVKRLEAVLSNEQKTQVPRRRDPRSGDREDR